MLYTLPQFLFASGLQYSVSLLQLRKLRIGEVKELAQGARPLWGGDLKLGGQVVESFSSDQAPEL